MTEKLTYLLNEEAYKKYRDYERPWDPYEYEYGDYNGEYEGEMEHVSRNYEREIFIKGATWMYKQLNKKIKLNK